MQSMQSFDSGSFEQEREGTWMRERTRPATSEFAQSIETYALVKSGPAVLAEEVEATNALAVEVMVLWGSNVLSVEHLSPPRSFYVGDSKDAGRKCDYLVPSELLGSDQAPLLLEGDDCP